MKKTIQVVAIIMFISGALFAQEPQITNVSKRKTTTLNGVWKYVVDPCETGYYDYRRTIRDTKAEQNGSIPKPVER